MCDLHKLFNTTVFLLESTQLAKKLIDLVSESMVNSNTNYDKQLFIL